MMSQTFTEETETLDDTIVARGGSTIDPQVSPAPDVSSVGFLSSGHVLSPNVSQIPDPHTNSTVIIGGARANTPPNVDVFEIPSIPTVTSQVSTDPSWNRSDLSTLGPDASPVTDKLGNLGIHNRRILGILYPQILQIWLKLKELKVMMIMSRGS